jgi:phasin family protein
MADVSQLLADWCKAIAGLDVSKGSEELENMLARLNVPGVDMEQLVLSQKDNLEALNAANLAAVEGLKAVGEWQVKILEETMRELSAAISRLGKINSPQQMVTTEADLVKKAFRTAVREMREIAKIVTAANQKATEAIVQRVPDSLDEIKVVLKIPPPPKAS